MSIFKMTALISGLVISSLVQAHNVWVEPTQNENEYVVKFGHEQTETYPEQKLKLIQVLENDNSIKPVAFQFKNGEAYFNVDSQPIVFLQFDNGVWSKLPSGKYVE